MLRYRSKRPTYKVEMTSHKDASIIFFCIDKIHSARDMTMRGGFEYELGTSARDTSFLLR
jgi:hypothetical protein